MGDADDETPLRTPAVKRGARSTASVSEVPTRPVAAVRRRPAQPDLGLLPRSLASLATIRCVEWLPGGLKGLLLERRRADFYEFEGGELKATSPSSWLLPRGWHYELHDSAGTLRFSIQRHQRWLLFSHLRVLDAQGQLVGRIAQRLSALEVHFDVFDGAGHKRFELEQPAGQYLTFWVKTEGREVGRIERDFVKWDGTLAQAVTLRDAFKLELNPALDELDRVLIIAASLLIDRLYFRNEKD